MKNLCKKQMQEIDGGYFAPPGTTLTGRDESMRKYAELAVRDIANGFWDKISSLWN